MLPFNVAFFWGFLRFKELPDPSFQQTYGSVYEGLKPTKRSSLAFPILFVFRRMILAITCLYLKDHLWLQMLLSIYITLFQGCYLVHITPFEESLQGKLEVFNELTTITLYITAYTLAEMPLDYANPENAANQHEMSSKFFIAALAGNIATHLFFLLMNTVRKTIIYSK